MGDLLDRICECGPHWDFTRCVQILRWFSRWALLKGLGCRKFHTHGRMSDHINDNGDYGVTEEVSLTSPAIPYPALRRLRQFPRLRIVIAVWIPP